MYKHIDWLPIDKQGRVVLTNYFGKNVPKEVGVSFDPLSGELTIAEDNVSPFRPTVDDKRRLIIPSRIRHKYFGGNQIHLVYDIDEKTYRLFSPDYL